MAVFAKTTNGTTAFSWARLLVAVVLLCGILAAAIMTAGDKDLEALNTMLVHGFELTLGLVLGLLGGDIANS